MKTTTSTLSSMEILEEALRPITGAVEDYDDLIESIGDRRVVLIGEASHGTHEFYRERARITQLLIERSGFSVVAVEGDWPDAYRVDRYVTGASDDANADEALSSFRRFPTWMWRNHEVVSFIEWLRDFNTAHADVVERVHFYGLDLYSLRASIEAVLAYLEKMDPEEAVRARERYSCFDHIGQDGQTYGYALAQGVQDPCEDEVVDQLIELRERGDVYLRRDGLAAQDELFSAERNALLVHNAEEYYRQMYRSGISSWNLRDRHMASTLEALVAHLEGRRGPAKVIVWAHNSHVGDARATAMGSRGELNVGQLARQRYGDDAFLIGFSTYDGHVSAASNWGGPVERKRVRPARIDSHEALLHEASAPQYWLTTKDLAVDEQLSAIRLERAIGVIYRPETELQSHYFAADLIRQFDVVVHIDRTRALQPLETTGLWDRGEPPETYPSGL
ncbi:MAG: erythromycin esterase family protein [Acidimicrobiales bacterium]